MHRTTLVALPLLLLAACFPALDPTPAEIPKLGSLKEVMHGNETLGGQLWSKIGSDTYSAEEFAKFKSNGDRMSALADRAKNFSRGPIFDKHADEMSTHGKALSAAADAKDAKAASSAMSSMKGLCKTCHAATR